MLFSWSVEMCVWQRGDMPRLTKVVESALLQKRHLGLCALTSVSADLLPGLLMSLLDIKFDGPSTT